MSSQSPKVTFKPKDLGRLPDALTQGAAIIMGLQRNGMLKTLSTIIKIRRQGGYCGLDVLLFLLLYFASGLGFGIKAFYKKVRPYKLLIAALARRKSLPSSSAIGRALDAVEVDLLRDYAHTIVLDIPQVDELLNHPVVCATDANGAPWHIFDIDPTVVTLRHRALTIDEDLPQPRRRSEDTGCAGWRGRKRGDIQFRSITAQHAGSGLWIHAHLSQGNGNRHEDMALCFDATCACIERLDHPRSHSCARFDGEWGNVPGFWACRQRQLPFVTRLTRASLLEDPQILAKLRAATWWQVPDSKAGPRRAACEMGSLKLKAANTTRKPDGGRYEPIEVRVVASIFPKEVKANHGRLIDGWQLELFAADLDAVAWPAPEVVGLYFGRAGQENRFAQEDREMGLGRIFSYHLPGQELATLAGLCVWNMQTVSGFELHKQGLQAPQPGPGQAVQDERVPLSWPRDPVLARLLAKVDWSAKFERRPRWSFEPKSGVIFCEEQRELTLTTVRIRNKGKCSLIFRRPQGGCQDCSVKGGCLRTTNLQRPTHAEFSVGEEVAAALHERQELVRQVGVVDAAEPRVQPGGQFEVQPGLFLPATTRGAWREVFEGVSVRVLVQQPSPPRRGLVLVARDIAQRQGRRKSWEQNWERYALADEISVELEVEGGVGFEHLWGVKPHRPPLRGYG